MGCVTFLVAYLLTIYFIIINLSDFPVYPAITSYNNPLSLSLPFPHRCTGAYATALVINGVGLLAFRDPHGIRPLCLGRKGPKEGHETDKESAGGVTGSGTATVGYAVASESVAIDALSMRYVCRYMT